ncbi:C-reactive protein isoform X2 [Balaenoptera acutorostrata]|uniref:C-reactive protein n=1 Tax=Balaenoptera acutorostrata TaxID=9767 RepID=A0A452C9G5_BALAC|nr:C-reactive protein isoform X2 [Balaenoptera acutorostrata]
MEKLSLYFLVIISLLSAFSQTDLVSAMESAGSFRDLLKHETRALYPQTFWSSVVFRSALDMHTKAFVFPKESDNSFVTLTAQLTKPLKAFTVCLHIYTDLTRDYSLFSYATRQQDNEILLFKGKTGVYSVSVGGADVFFKPPESSPTPMHFCVTWESTSGITELWVDGKPMVRRSMKRGYSLGTEASIVLGQEQDAFAGGFDKNQSLVGDIGDVNMWDYVLSPEEINTVYAGGTFSPNVLDWRALKYKTYGEVFVKRQLWP